MKQVLTRYSRRRMLLLLLIAGECVRQSNEFVVVVNAEQLFDIVESLV